MNVHLSFVALAAAAALALMSTGCSDSSTPQRTASSPGTSAGASASDNTQPPRASAVQTPPPLPQEKPPSGETAQASDNAMQPMSKEDESKRMPQPGQVNDYSTTAPGRNREPQVGAK